MAARIWMAGVGLSLMAMGWIFISYLWGSYQRAAAMDAWKESACMIESSELADAGLSQHYAPKYRVAIRYRYEWEGESYIGEKIRRLPKSSPDKAKIERIRKQYRAGESATCYINPDKPEEAVLKKDSKAALYSIWFPCLFFLGGLGIIASQLRRT